MTQNARSNPRIHWGAQRDSDTERGFDETKRLLDVTDDERRFEAVLTKRACAMRASPTSTEQLLWQHTACGSMFLSQY